ncbi:hypothetical protein [Nocardioides dilutus]
MAGIRVFFGHQSVGQNVLDGVRRLADRGEPVPVVHDALIGDNEDPLSKIADFDTRVRGGLGAQVDVAMMKLCYIDVTVQTDVDALFGTYRTTLSALERDHPTVTFVHVTVPLTTERSGLSRLRARLTGNDRFGPDENAVRERLNALIRDAYAGQHLFDLAAVESTRPDGTRVSGRHDGSGYFALFDGYASDLGHLNDAGAEVAAAAWLRTVARAARGGRI